MPTADDPRAEALTLPALAEWLDEEYRRLAARSLGGGSVEQYALGGRLMVLGEVAAIIRSGALPSHIVAPPAPYHSPICTCPDCAGGRR